ncbi:MarR family winged helix-turn-helix transcriptional regulator [Nonomuraea sp. NPDC051941]|uniref:MarR family winged helix-turn-helix transcriptional regulator n=1 Tax=Nonomuraea sp. NPDC051941 TaxID=3364373 RepID=UPI0037CA89F2
MERNLSLDLHVLTARLDRAADRLLRASHGISYSRFLALTLVGGLGATTQRTLAEYLGVTEASVSRMTGVLAADGLLDVRPDPGGGRRHRLSLTKAGEELVTSVRRGFEDKLAVLVEQSGIAYEEYAEQTARLLSTFDRLEKGAGR